MLRSWSSSSSLRKTLARCASPRQPTSCARSVYLMIAPNWPLERSLPHSTRRLRPTSTSLHAAALQAVRC
eukprot:3283615-Lingulodinium_polyedra.AAC.1